MDKAGDTHYSFHIMRENYRQPTWSQFSIIPYRIVSSKVSYNCLMTERDYQHRNHVKLTGSKLLKQKWQENVTL